jgi:16S rRNA (adenine1518-N6/adenine1519-N6)-dimethyltransferase
MRQFEVRPDRELGQNFLVDSNILGVIGAAAELRATDVVLEVGGGLGVLSEYLAVRVAHLHVVEVDRRLAAPLEDAVGAFDNVSLHWGDAMRLDLASLTPTPNAMVANLPYGIATALLVRTLDELPRLGRWLVMVQREVGERLAAAPAGAATHRRRDGGRSYGATSVVVQLACAVQIVRVLPRTIFLPVPNVDSVLLAMRRLGTPPSSALRDLVYGAFAHRRKSLVRSLALAAPATGVGRERLQAALVQMGHPADVRAERLSPEEFRTLARALGLTA